MKLMWYYNTCLLTFTFTAFHSSFISCSQEQSVVGYAFYETYIRLKGRKENSTNSQVRDVSVGSTRESSKEKETSDKFWMTSSTFFLKYPNLGEFFHPALLSGNSLSHCAMLVIARTLRAYNFCEFVLRYECSLIVSQCIIGIVVGSSHYAIVWY